MWSCTLACFSRLLYWANERLQSLLRVRRMGLPFERSLSGMKSEVLAKCLSTTKGLLAVRLSARDELSLFLARNYGLGLVFVLELQIH